jgi:type III pantothenate kinase
MLVDVGNTNLKWASRQGGKHGSVLSVPHGGGPLPDLLDRCWGSAPRPDRLMVSNVAGVRVADDLTRWCAERWGLSPDYVRPVRRLLGVTNGYKHPSQLGVDRLLAMAAVHRRWARSACLVDSGTAVTLDALDGQGRHFGGLILPGFDMMRWALEQRTAIAAMGAPQGLELLARDTATAVESGPVQAVAALIDRIMRGLDQGPDTPLLVLTGSGAARLAPALERTFERMENLVIAGLALAAEDREDW